MGVGRPACLAPSVRAWGSSSPPAAVRQAPVTQDRGRLTSSSATCGCTGSWRAQPWGAIDTGLGQGMSLGQAMEAREQRTAPCCHAPPGRLCSVPAQPCWLRAPRPTMTVVLKNRPRPVMRERNLGDSGHAVSDKWRHGRQTVVSGPSFPVTLNIHPAAQPPRVTNHTVLSAAALTAMTALSWSRVGRVAASLVLSRPRRLATAVSGTAVASQCCTARPRAAGRTTHLNLLRRTPPRPCRPFAPPTGPNRCGGAAGARAPALLGSRLPLRRRRPRGRLPRSR